MIFVNLFFINFASFMFFLEKSRNPKWRTKWPPLKTDYVIPTSYEVINPFCKRQRKKFLTYYLLIKSHCHSFNSLKVLKGGGGAGNQAPPPRLRKEKKNRLNRVSTLMKIVDIFKRVFFIYLISFYFFAIGIITANFI